MKKDKIIYWTTTILFALFMLSTSIPSEEGKTFILQLGYPAYFIPFIAVAKLLGCIAILMPFLKKLKEWAYAGLCFDLTAATYSLIMVHGFDPGMITMLVAFAVMAVSYIYNDKLHNKMVNE